MNKTNTFNEFLSGTGIIELCDAVGRQTSELSDIQKDNMILKYLDKNGSEIRIEVSGLDSAPLEVKMMVANYFYSSVLSYIEKTAKVILLSRIFMPLSKFFIDNKHRETIINEQILSEIEKLSSGRSDASGKNVLLGWIKSQAGRKKDFMTRLICSAIIHLDLLCIAIFGFIKLVAWL